MHIGIVHVQIVKLSLCFYFHKLLSPMNNKALTTKQPRVWMYSGVMVRWVQWSPWKRIDRFLIAYECRLQLDSKSDDNMHYWHDSSWHWNGNEFPWIARDCQPELLCFLECFRIYFFWKPFPSAHERIVKLDLLN